MTTRELFELASLDALGLLDEDERASFERAFRSALPHIQAQIRREQLRHADIESVLPQVDPPAGLRAKVVSAVREAMAQVRTEPVGRIGPSGSWLSTTAFWRAACIGFATATVVLAGFVLTVAQQNRQIASDVLSNDFASSVAAIGGTSFVDVVTRPGVRPVAFRPAAPDYNGNAQASLIIDPETKVAYLVCKGLPIDNGDYTLVIGDRNRGIPERVERFRVSAKEVGIQLDKVDIDQVNAVRILAPMGTDGKAETIMVVDDAGGEDA